MCVTAGKDGQVAAVELRLGKKKGAGVGAPGWKHIHLARGIFAMEHLLATMVSVPLSPGRMHIHSARGIRTMEHLLAMMVSLPASPLSVGQATIIFFI
jgi:hypothetical protein